MKKTKRNRKLLIQITAIVLPLFLILIGAVVWLCYRSAVNSYLSAQNENIERDLDETYLSLVDSLDAEKEKENEWLISYLENSNDRKLDPLTKEEWEEMDIETEGKIFTGLTNGS